jgi:hypothetical protein
MNSVDGRPELPASSSPPVDFLPFFFPLSPGIPRQPVVVGTGGRKELRLHTGSHTTSEIDMKILKTPCLASYCAPIRGHPGAGLSETGISMHHA